MNKEEYLKKLSKLVKKMPEEDRNDIISDYEEHFRIGMEKGRSEEEIAKALGNPESVVKQIKAEYKINKAENEPSATSIVEAVLAAAGLGLFNLIFVAIPALVLVAIIVTLFVVGFVVIFGGIFVTLSPLLGLIFNYHLNMFKGVGIWNGVITVICGVSLTLLGTILVAAMLYLAKGFYNMAIRYLKWNLRIINERTNV